METIIIKVKEVMESDIAVSITKCSKLLKKIDNDVKIGNKLIIDFNGINIITFDFIKNLLVHINNKYNMGELFEFKTDDEDIMERIETVKKNIEKIEDKNNE